jgi:sporulation protein YlmC with PRC-barrel domain
MLAKYLTAGAAGSLLLAAVAFAAPPTISESQLQGNSWRTSKVVGLNVYNDKNETVGSINELLMDKSGSVKAAVLSVGGFLGMGSHYVAVPFDQLKFSTEPIVYTTSSNTGAPSGAGGAGGGGAGGGGAGGMRPGGGTTTGAAAPVSKPNPWYPDHAVFNTTKDELKDMPEFKFSSE